MKTIDEQLDLLGKIEEIDPPHFLFSKIEAKIANTQKLYAPKKMVLTLGSLATCCLFLSLFIGIRSYSKSKTENIATSIELLPDNNFYDE